MYTRGARRQSYFRHRLFFDRFSLVPKFQQNIFVNGTPLGSTGRILRPKTGFQRRLNEVLETARTYVFQFRGN
jgi:hypothetical protein